VFVFEVPIAYSVLLKKSSLLTTETFNELMQRPNQVKSQNSFPTSHSPDKMKEVFGHNNIGFVYSQKNESGVEMMSFSCIDVENNQIGIQMILNNGNAQF